MVTSSDAEDIHNTTLADGDILINDIVSSSVNGTVGNEKTKEGILVPDVPKEVSYHANEISVKVTVGDGEGVIVSPEAKAAGV